VNPVLDFAFSAESESFAASDFLANLARRSGV
jgi:hypothetical protein